MSTFQIIFEALMVKALLCSCGASKGGGGGLYDSLACDLDQVELLESMLMTLHSWV